MAVAVDKRIIIKYLIFFHFTFCFLHFYFFFVTSTAIKTALKQENLNPEIEEKLLQLQRYQEKQMKQEPDVPSQAPKVVPVVSNVRVPPSSSRKRVPSSSKNDDSEWVMETPKRTRPNRNNETKKFENESQ